MGQLAFILGFCLTPSAFSRQGFTLLPDDFEMPLADWLDHDALRERCYILGLYPIVTLEKPLLNMTVNLV